MSSSDLMGTFKANSELLRTGNAGELVLTKPARRELRKMLIGVPVKIRKAGEDEIGSVIGHVIHCGRKDLTVDLVRVLTGEQYEDILEMLDESGDQPHAVVNMQVATNAGTKNIVKILAVQSVEAAAVQSVEAAAVQSVEAAAVSPVNAVKQID